MNKFILFLFVTFFLSPMESLAQGGYLGQKTAIYIFGDISSYQRLSKYAKPWSKRIGIAGSRTVSRNLEVTVAAQFMKGGAHPKAYKGREVHYSKVRDKEDNMNCYGGKIGLKWFRYSTGSISPIGTFWGVELSVDYNDVNDVLTVLPSSSDENEEQVEFNMTYLKTQAWFKIGWQNIVGEHFIIGGELRTGGPPIIIETSNSGAINFRHDQDAFIDFFNDSETTFYSLTKFEFGRNFLVPEIHIGYLF